MTTLVDPETQGLYSSSRLTKGTASLDEVQTLLLYWQPGEPAIELAERVRQEGVLTKQTAQRMRDLVVRIFGVWFLSPDDRGARQLKAFVQAGGERRTLNELAFLYKARSEAVLYDFTLQRFWPACNDGALYLRTADIQDFLLEAQQIGRFSAPLSAQTQERLAQGIFGALTTVGFLSEERRYAREYVLYRVSDFTLAYLAYDLHGAGLTDAAIAGHSDWALFGLTREQALNRLDEIAERAGLIVQRAGSLVRFTWLYKTMEEVIDAYIR